MPLCSFCQWEAEKITYTGETVHTEEIPTESGLAPGESCSRCRLDMPELDPADIPDFTSGSAASHQRAVVTLSIAWAIIAVAADLALASVVGLAAVGIAANDIAPPNAFFLATMAAFCVMTLKSAGGRLIRR